MTTFLPFRKVGFVKEESIEYAATINNPTDAVRAAIEVLDIQSEIVENLYLIALDNRKKICGMSVLSRGTSSKTFMEPKAVFRDALLHNAVSIIVMHNHPSGDPTPSGNDLDLTKRLHCVGVIIGIDLDDHIVVGNGSKGVATTSIRRTNPEIWVV